MTDFERFVIISRILSHARKDSWLLIADDRSVVEIIRRLCE
jgi:hypothetical protein